MTLKDLKQEKDEKPAKNIQYSLLPTMKLKQIEVKEKNKILIMVVLLAICCAITYYFHIILGIFTVFSHFFYLPIVLAATWWRRKGLVVTLFLSFLLIFSHLDLRMGAAISNDLFRIPIFIITGCVVAILSESSLKASRKTAHLYTVLGAIQKVNQIIIREQNRDRMIQGVCDSLIETKGYYSACIALINENNEFLTAAGSGMDKQFSQIKDMMMRGEFTLCGQNVLEHSDIIISRDTAANGPECFPAGYYSDNVGMTIRLEHQDRIYGIFSVSIPAGMVDNADEQGLFSEVAGDISFALHSMEVEEARIKAEANIKHLNSVLKAIRNVNQLIVVETDMDILLQKACDTLVEARSYEAVWLGFIQNGDIFATVKDSGFKEDMSHFSEYVVSGNHPSCIREMLAGNDMFTIVEKSRECVDCPFKDACSSQEVMISRVEHSGRLYGLLAVSITADIGISEDDEQLLTEVSADIGLALYKMEIEKAHKMIREELQDSEEKLSQIVSTNPIPCFAIDMDHTVTHWNKACENLTGVSASKVVGTKKVWPYFYPEERPVMLDLIVNKAFEQDIASYYKGVYKKSPLIDMAYEAEGFFPDLGDSGKWLFFTASPLKDRHGKVIGAIETLQDITKRKQDEEILSNVNAELEEQVAKRTAELEEKNAELESMNKVFVGRELRMAELKEQIDKLEKDT